MKMLLMKTIRIYSEVSLKIRMSMKKFLCQDPRDPTPDRQIRKTRTGHSPEKKREMRSEKCTPRSTCRRREKTRSNRKTMNMVKKSFKSSARILLRIWKGKNWKRNSELVIVKSSI